MENPPELPEAPQSASCRRKRTLIISSVAIAALALAGGTFVFLSDTPPPKPKSAARDAGEQAAKKRLQERAAKKARQTEEKQAAEEPQQMPEEVPTPAPPPAPEPEQPEEPVKQDAEPAPPQQEEPQNPEPAPQNEPEPEPDVQPETDTPTETPQDKPSEPAPAPAEPTVQAIDVTNAAAVEGAALRAIEEGNYQKLAESLIPGIRNASQELLSGSKLNYAAYRRADSLMTAVELTVLIKTVGEEQLRALTQGKEAGPGKNFMNWMLRDRVRPLRSFIRNFMAQEAAPENMAYSLRTFFTIWKDTPEQDRARYLNPAIACALLSPEVAQSPGLIRVKTARLTPAQVFQYFREQDKHRRLLTDIKKMSVERLLMVVDVRLPKSEFTWVTKHLKYDRATWAHKAYNSVRYLMERATKDTPILHILLKKFWRKAACAVIRPILQPILPR